MPGDIVAFLAAAFPDRNAVPVQLGTEAQADFEMHTLYSYIAEGTAPRLLEACVGSFPSVDGGLAANIEGTRAKLGTKPDWYAELPYGDIYGPAISAYSNRKGEGWTLMVGASQLTGRPLREAVLVQLFQLRADFCEEVGRCVFSNRPDE